MEKVTKSNILEGLELQPFPDLELEGFDLPELVGFGEIELKVFDLPELIGFEGVELVEFDLPQEPLSFDPVEFPPLEPVELKRGVLI